MRNNVSKYYKATFYCFSIIAIFAGLGIETYTTIPVESAGGIGDYPWFLTMICIFLVFVKLKDYQQLTAAKIKLTSVDSKKHF